MSPPTPCGALSARALLRRQFELAHDLLDAAIEGLPTEAIHQRPPGTAAPIGACYAQVVLCEDLSVNAVLAASTPLALSTWAGRTGLSELPPLARPADWHVWARRVRLDLAALRPYARAVFAATDTYLAALPNEALDSAHGERPACLLSALLLTLSMRRGEIACLLALERPPTARPAFRYTDR
ncbi:MAG TPA: DinB family protein [Chloroflexota bacterium]|jgi:hypothetical protein|nr:DinB family protein [Chloroflexota bacterium]